MLNAFFNYGIPMLSISSGKIISTESQLLELMLIKSSVGLGDVVFAFSIDK